MGKAGRDEQLPVVHVVEPDTHPSAEALRVGSNVDRDVEHGAAHDGHELALTPLVVETAQHVARRTRKVVLDESNVDTRLAIGVQPKRLEEVTSAVGVSDGLEHQHFGKRGLVSLHRDRRLKELDVASG
jgi:hypothetical protein